VVGILEAQYTSGGSIEAGISRGADATAGHDAMDQPALAGDCAAAEYRAGFASSPPIVAETTAAIFRRRGSDIRDAAE
jgi:hypothetical protein